MLLSIDHLLHSLTLAAGVGLTVLVLYRVYRAFLGPLRDVPGPILARFTRLWEVYYAHQGQFEHVNIALHERYGES